MKRVLSRIAVGIVLLTVGFFAGRFVQDAKSGYRYSVTDEATFGPVEDPVRLRVVHESVGFAMLSPNSTVLEYRGRIIYKAQRIFQEGFPHAKNVAVTDRQITWEDGELKFRLEVEELEGGGMEPTKGD